MSNSRRVRRHRQATVWGAAGKHVTRWTRIKRWLGMV
jgi:hypothetical protein